MIQLLIDLCDIKKRLYISIYTYSMDGLAGYREILLYRPICVEITGSTGKHSCTTYKLREYMEALLYYVAIVCAEIAGRTGKHFCTTHELRDYRKVLIYYIALCMRRMWEYM